MATSTLPDEPDLDELATWCRDWIEPGSYVKPADLQRERRLTWNQACSALEALEARGDLERLPGAAHAYRPTPPPQKPGKGYALPLSSKEHGALLRLLDGPDDGRCIEDRALLRAIRSRLKRPS